MKFLSIFLVSALLLVSCSRSTLDESFFIFEPDVRLFTAYSFMNAAGYDHDWMDEMHPIRIDVRAYLDSILTSDYKEEIRAIYSKLGGGNFYAYGASALHVGDPPSFEFTGETWEFEYLEKFSGYDSLLRKFYREANIGELWQKYKSQLREMNIRYKPYAEHALGQITEYCRVDTNFYQNIAGNIHYQEIPLMSHWTAYFCELENEYWIIRGPSPGDPGPGGFYHEALHKIVNPIVEANGEHNKRITPLVQLAQEKLRGDYNSEIGILCESLVRSIDLVLTASYYEFTKEELSKKIEDEYRLGHILCFYLFEKLPEYESNQMTLREYYPTLINEIDIEYEINRWQDYWQNDEE